MATKKKMLQAAAGNATGGAALNVEDVFSTYLYEGNEGVQAITNGIDLDGEGGLVWIKNRDGERHALFDDQRGLNSVLASNEDSGPRTRSGWMQSFNSNGFTLNSGDTEVNNSGDDYASWTFRKAPKFFDVVTWTSTGSSSQRVNHSLGATPGLVAIKRTDSTGPWMISPLYSDGDRGYGSPNEASKFGFNTNSPITTKANLSSGFTDTDFRPNYVEGYSTFSCISGATYVAYLFAHNDGDGEFGPDGDADIIKCGSYTGGSGNTEIDLGFEPQFLMIKRTDSAEDWLILDVMRGLIVSGDDVASSGQKDIMANTSAAEATPSYAGVSPQPNGFKVRSGLDALYSANGGDYIYIAIRRGPMAVPEDATEVFAPVTGSGLHSTGFPVDFLIGLNDTTNVQSYDPFVKTRLLGGASYLTTSNTAAEVSATDVGFDAMDGLTYSWPYSTSVAWYWRRAPGFFDAVAYKSTTSAQTLNHNLSAIPEMMWIKNRDDTKEWQVYHSALGNTKYLQLNTIDTEATASNRWNNTSPTDTQFTIGTAQKVNDVTTTRNYIAYLFASLDGVSKVGSYTGDNVNGRVIDCGFSSGARFVLIKSTSQAGDWHVFDTERGLVSGNDARLELNTTDAETSSADIIDPSSSGFALTNRDECNETGVTYIFYAIA